MHLARRRRHRPEVEFRRPGHGRRTCADIGWERALNDYSPFLSYADLDKVLNGRPSEPYDSVDATFGLGELTDVDERLQLSRRCSTPR
ncbi:hypothetical protein GCM10010254_01520 [Streptomyces chromofuscus]|nr:hypothetical protein GCM10010254_01520 [Streptomyces chromofuscus]